MVRNGIGASHSEGRTSGVERPMGLKAEGVTNDSHSGAPPKGDFVGRWEVVDSGVGGGPPCLGVEPWVLAGPWASCDRKG